MPVGSIKSYLLNRTAQINSCGKFLELDYRFLASSGLASGHRMDRVDPVDLLDAFSGVYLQVHDD